MSEFGAVQRDTNLVDSERSEKCAYSRYRSCRSCRFRKLLQDAPSLDIGGVGTAENEPAVSVLMCIV